MEENGLSNKGFSSNGTATVINRLIVTFDTQATPDYVIF